MSDGMTNRAYSFQQVREAAVRASYRGILGREPEAAALAALKAAPLLAEEERELTEIVRRAVDSEEFRGRAPSNKFAQNTWVICPIDSNLLLWVDLGDRGVSLSCLSQDYELSETNFLRKITKPGMTFVDIGANIGWFSVHAAQWVGAEGRVIAFEPRNVTYGKLVQSLALNGFSDRTECHNIALLEAAGATVIGCDESTGNPGGTWTLPSAAMQADFRSHGLMVQEVRASTLDEVLGGRRVDVIKIDIEGAEPMALRGGVTALTTFHPTILSEISFDALAAVSNSSPRDFIAWMASLGYRCNLMADGEVGRAFDGVEPPDGRRLVNVVFSHE